MRQVLIAYSANAMPLALARGAGVLLARSGSVLIDRQLRTAKVAIRAERRWQA
jgi:hypothetical protein